MTFSRRVHDISACMRLHNVCVNRRLQQDTLASKDDGREEVFPGHWLQPPRFDKNGRPVEFLDWVVDAPVDKCVRDGRRENNLRTAIRKEGLVRPL